MEREDAQGKPAARTFHAAVVVADEPPGLYAVRFGVVTPVWPDRAAQDVTTYKEKMTMGPAKRPTRGDWM